MKVRVIRVFRVPDCDTRITRTKFGFCKLLPEIPKQNSGFGYFGFEFGYSGFEFRVTGFLPSPRRRPSAEARAESEPWGRAKWSPSSSGAEPESEPWVWVERSSPSSGLSPSPSPGSGGAEFAIFRAEPESEPWVRWSGVRRLPG
jgi:hypothetical protein